MYIDSILSKKHLAIIFSVAILFFSCETFNDFDKAGPSANGTIDLQTRVTVPLISGFVTDENNFPLMYADVEADGSKVSTDKYGYFEIKNAVVVQNAATVKITRNNYFTNVHTFIATDGKRSFFRVKLMLKKFLGTFNTVSGGQVSSSAGFTIAFAPNSIVKAGTNISYNGSVNVKASWIDPTASDVNQLMPGDLRGIATGNDLQLLSSFGMAAVELQGSAGETLQIASANKATLSFPIPAAIQNYAPAAIPLWYFDEAIGLWKEEGTATRNGNIYSGEVHHFSFWNCDIPNSFVRFDTRVVNLNGQPFASAVVRITDINNPCNVGYGYTDNAGYVSGAIPRNAQLKLEVLAGNACPTPLFTTTIHTGVTAISMGTITVNGSVALISGSATDCNNTPLTNGYLMINDGSSYHRIDINNNGTYSYTLPVCNNGTLNCKIIVVDPANLYQSNPQSYTLQAGTNNIPVIQACGASADSYFSYSTNGSIYTYLTPGDIVRQQILGILTRYNIYVSGSPANPGSPTLFFEGDSIHVGSHQTFVNFYGPGMPFGVPVNPTSVLITEYGSIGQHIAGNFSAIFKDTTTNILYNVTCKFRFIRVL